jgi:uncharacterized protein (DUF302 family)
MRNLKFVVIAAVCFFIGVVATSLLLQSASARLFLLETKSPYDFAKTVTTVTERIAAKPGWKVVNVIDQERAILDGGAPSPGKVTIVELCNSAYSSQMLQGDARKRMAVNMPIRIGVYERSTGEVYIGLLNGYLMSKLYGGETEKIIEKVSLDMEGIMSFANFKYNAY